MAQDFLQIVISTSVGLASLALSSGMMISNGGNTGTLTPPPPGSHDSPIPPEDLLKGAPSPNNYVTSYENYAMMQDGNPQTRGGGLFPVGDYQPGGGPTNQRLPPGSNVTQGPIPVSDVPDLSYCSLILEAPVPPTADQVPWFCTCTLCKGGNTGPKGERGDRGPPGQPGSPGVRGFTGSQGRPGFVGQQGMKGVKGDAGPKGDQGVIGPQGRKGDVGPKGEKGDAGVNGNPGLQGLPGDPGQCPSSCQFLNGPPGEAGLPGIVGQRGLPGVTGLPGTKGLKGDKGEVGLPGIPGLSGQKGNQGDEGPCNCMDGAKGAPGNPGLSGPKGDKGDAGNQGLAGVNGLKGHKGDEGLPGPPGLCSPAIQSAFSARLGDLYPKPDLPVPFTNVIYNLQFHFNPTLGVYKAPVNGTYVFSYNLVVFNKALKVGLFSNFKPIVKSTEFTSLETVSQEVVLHLNSGDEVWLQVKDTSNNGMYANSESSSTFSGFLLYPDSCDAPLSRELGDIIIKGDYNWGVLDNPDNNAQ